ncbi:surfactant protein Bb, partial [Aplochiton taeniatus]
MVMQDPANLKWDIAKTSLTSDLCSECSKIIELSIDMLSNNDTQKPGEICAVLGLCVDGSQARPQGLANTGSNVPGAHVDKKKYSEVEISPQCTFCVFLIKKLEDLLPKERTEDAVVKALEKVCETLPGSFKDQCADFVSKYGKQVVDFLLSSAAPHTICSLLHLCLFEESPKMEMPQLPSDCNLCRILAVLGGRHLGLN